MSKTHDPHAKEMEDLLHVLWKNNYGTLLERLMVLRSAQERLAVGTLDRQARRDAEEAAHKLAGILGTFGLPHGSALASEIEAWLAREADPATESAPQLKSWVDQLEAIMASRPRAG
jgi:HPt (histidine-containing phosphotransfer) domain-containing protein